MRIKETVSPNISFSPSFCSSWSTCWFTVVGLSLGKGSSLPPICLTSSSGHMPSQDPTGLIPKRLQEFVAVGLKGQEGSLEKREQVKGLCGSSQEECKNSDLFGGLAGPQSQGSKKINIIGHIKNEGGDLMEIKSRHLLATSTPSLCNSIAIEFFGFPT